MMGRGGDVSEGDTRPPRGGGGGALPSSGTARRLLPVKVTKASTLSVEGPRSVPSRISVVLVDGTTAGDTPGWECPREDESWRPGKTRPAGVSVGGGDAGRPLGGETLSALDSLEHLGLDQAGPVGRQFAYVAGRSRPVVAAGGGGLPQWVLRTLWAPMARLLQVAPLARVRHCLKIFSPLWNR